MQRICYPLRRMDSKAQKLLKDIPDTPGVYIMKGETGILYVGKAGNLKRRVSSYFLGRRNFSGGGSGPPAFANASAGKQEYRLERLIKEIQEIEFRQTDTAIEALILEAELIKKYKPPFNVREKDDKSFLFVEITREKFPRVLLARGKEKLEGGILHRGSSWYGPFTSATSIREALRILRKIFPWHIHTEEQIKKMPRACFEYEIGLCPGTCAGEIEEKDYKRNIKNLKLIFEGKKARIVRSLESDMKKSAKLLEFERAEELKRQLFALQHIRDISSLKEESPVLKESKTRIEGYDISNISGTSAVGSMVVFMNDQPDKNEYRKFKIKTLFEPNDVGMLKEVLTRRFTNWNTPTSEKAKWPLPNLILVDGGLPQVGVAKQVLNEMGLRIPLVGLAKGAERKRNDVFGRIPDGVSLETLIKVRDEAHRFAIAYHKNLRGRNFFK